MCVACPRTGPCIYACVRMCACMRVCVGVVDHVMDGRQPFEVFVGRAQSTVSQWHNVPCFMSPVAGVSFDSDNPTAGALQIESPLPRITSEDQTRSYVMNVSLGLPITAGDGSVVVQVRSNNTLQTTVHPSSLAFDASNWWVPQAVLVKGELLHSRDGDAPIEITYSAVLHGVAYNYTFDSTLLARGCASGFCSLNTTDPRLYVCVRVYVCVWLGLNLDYVAKILVSPLSGPVNELGTTANFTAWLEIEPHDPVHVSVYSNVTDEGTRTGA